MIPSFTHFHVHSSYSLGIGLSTPEEICAFAKRAGFASVALTDTNGTYGFIEFHLAAERHGLKPIYGAVVYLGAVAKESAETFPATAIALDGEGLANVAALAGISAAEPGGGIALDALAAHSRGVAVFSGSGRSEIGRLLLNGEGARAADVARALREIFSDRFFLEVQDHGEKAERRLAVELLQLAAASGVKPLLTQEVRYAGRGLENLYGLLRGVQHPTAERDFFRIDESSVDRGMKSAGEMASYYDVYRDAFENTVALDRRVEIDLYDEIEREAAESFMSELREDPREILTSHAFEQFEHALANAPDADRVRYRGILEREIHEIVSAGLSRTFFVFYRILSEWRRSGITLGPATGLTLQSLCAYVLGITSFNPYRFRREFHAMFDPTAGASAAIEVQLASEERAAAIRRLKRVLDPRFFAYAPAVERITPSRAVKMVSKVTETGADEVRTILDVMGKHPGVSIKQLCEEEEALGKLYKRSVHVRELLTRASLLENIPWGFIRSKRSLILSPVPLADFLGQSRDPSTGDVFVHATRDVLPVGHFSRLDFTPLGALSIVFRTERGLPDELRSATAWERIPVEDPEAFDEIGRGDGMGVFLFEGRRIQQYRESFELSSIEALTDFVGLMRFGQESTLFNERLRAYREGKTLDYAYRPELNAIVNATRGVILYDEQLRDILCILTGMDPPGAYRLLQRFRSMSPGVLSALRIDFMRGTADQNIPMEEANRWFERILYHAKHSIYCQRALADALLVYKSAYLKVHHRGLFTVALLKTYSNHEDKLRKYLGVLKGRGLLLDVDINRSEISFSLEGDTVRLGLYGLEGLSPKATLQIIKRRGKRGFASLEDFLEKTKDADLTRADVRRLIEAGAFDAFGDTRENLLQTLSRRFGRRRSRKTPEDAGQLELPFDGPPGAGER